MTPIQELIEKYEIEVEKLTHNVSKVFLQTIIGDLKAFLPKEKQMVIDAYNSGAVTDPKRALQGEQHYNKLLKQ